ncbi:hypothetical protein RISK_002632 [Rhodopirellula islandica]|uniref:Uncharacterized protein n=1 Tax=Rhodopirellula islandica TaxID=595434 RepID=A0A0J1BFV9_RHOIS|nr:hypothetical protein RISK_002632 [Rhodopirellula islandica]
MKFRCQMTTPWAKQSSVPKFNWQKGLMPLKSRRSQERIRKPIACRLETPPAFWSAQPCLPFDLMIPGCFRMATRWNQPPMNSTCSSTAVLTSTKPPSTLTQSNCFAPGKTGSLAPIQPTWTSTETQSTTMSKSNWDTSGCWNREASKPATCSRSSCVQPAAQLTTRSIHRLASLMTSTKLSWSEKATRHCKASPECRLTAATTSKQPFASTAELRSLRSSLNQSFEPTPPKPTRRAFSHNNRTRLSCTSTDNCWTWVTQKTPRSIASSILALPRTIRTTSLHPCNPIWQRTTLRPERSRSCFPLPSQRATTAWTSGKLEHQWVDHLLSQAQHSPATMTTRLS